jgi:hypothetical protein
MARPLRIQYENAYYHVTCRGNARQEIYLQDADRAAFLKFLARSAEIYQVEVLAYGLMANHFHLLVKTPLGIGQPPGIHAPLQYLLHLLLQSLPSESGSSLSGTLYGFPPSPSSAVINFETSKYG